MKTKLRCMLPQWQQKRKIMRMAADDKLDEALYLWFVQKRSQGMPVSGPVLSEKATQLNSKIHGDSAPDFKASKGWLWRFCNRHGMRQLSIQGEKLSSDMTAPDPFKEELQTVMENEGLTLENLCNCDETYRMLPTKTLASRSEMEAPGMKKQKDRITLMACANATGTHRSPLLFVGKAANPRCFKKILYL